MRWEDGDNVTRGIPSRVVQYEGSFLMILSSFLFDQYPLVLPPWESILSII